MGATGAGRLSFIIGYRECHLIPNHSFHVMVDFVLIQISLKLYIMASVNLAL